MFERGYSECVPVTRQRSDSTAHLYMYSLFGLRVSVAAEGPKQTALPRSSLQLQRLLYQTPEPRFTPAFG